MKMSTPSEKDNKPRCGIVMPISDMDAYRPGHWADVLKIITDAVSSDFEADLVITRTK